MNETEKPDVYKLVTKKGRVLSKHPNMVGAKLCALFHMKNGESCYWHDGLYGHINGRHRFSIVRMDRKEITQTEIELD